MTEYERLQLDAQEAMEYDQETAQEYHRRQAKLLTQMQDLEADRLIQADQDHYDWEQDNLESSQEHMSQEWE